MVQPCRNELCFKKVPLSQKKLHYHLSVWRKSGRLPAAHDVKSVSKLTLEASVPPLSHLGHKSVRQTAGAGVAIWNDSLRQEPAQTSSDTWVGVCEENSPRKAASSLRCQKLRLGGHGFEEGMFSFCSHTSHLLGYKTQPYPIFHHDK